MTVLTRPQTRRIPLYGWLTAEAVSLLGTRVSMIAIPWLVLTTTGSATRTGLVAVAEITPMVLFKAFGGPLVDRVGPRRMAITTDLLSFVAVGMIPLLHRSGTLTFPLLLGLVAIAGALRGPGDAATTALIPALVEKAGVPYERATGLASAIERGGTMVGAAIAGGLVAAVGAANAVVVDALSFALCALVLLVTTRSLEERSRKPARRDEPRAGEPATSYVTDLRDGWNFLRHDAVLMSLCVMIAVTNLLDLAWSAVLLPVWAHDSGAGVGAVGLVFSVFGGASVVGALAAAAYGTRLPRFQLYVVAFLITGLPRFLVFALGAPFWMIIAMCLVGGVFSGFLNPVIGAVEFERIPRDMVGRVTALTSAMCWSLMPLGGILGGVLVTGIGLDPALIVIGVAYFVTTMAPTLLPSFRGMNRQEAQPEREPVAA